MRYIEYSRLPKTVKLGNAGIIFTIFMLTVGRAIVGIIDWIKPGIKGNGIPPWMWPVLIVIWTPGALGLLASFYSVVRYPYLSMATGGGERIITSRSWIWVFLGSVFCIIAPLLTIIALTLSDSLWESFLLAYMAIVFAFAGFLAAVYRREKHLTIASFLELTFGIGVLLLPFYVPSLIIGSVRCRRLIRSLNAIDEAN